MDRNEAKRIMESGKEAEPYCFPITDHCQDAGPILQLSSAERLAEMEIFQRLRLFCFSDDVPKKRPDLIGVAFVQDPTGEKKWFHITAAAWKRLYASVAESTMEEAEAVFKKTFPGMVGA
jgi:hypothetical protein